MKIKMLNVVMVAILFGCADFLEETSQSEVHPSTVTEMEKILQSNAYLDGTEGRLFEYKTEVFTDDVESQAVVTYSQENRKNQERWRFAWDPDMFNETGGGQDVTFWQIPYQKIMGCNVVLDYIGEMNGDEVKREYLRGEAYALRGFYYLTLINFFAMPYNAVNPATEPGVPLKLISGVADVYPERNTVGETYAQIVADLEMGAELMKNNEYIEGLSLLRINYLAAYGLLTRAYLYMEEWDNVIRYADSVLKVKPDLLDLNMAGYYTVYDNGYQDEVLWMNNMNGLNDRAVDALGILYPFTASVDLQNVYAADQSGNTIDIRGDMGAENSNATAAYLLRGNYWDRGMNIRYPYIAGADKCHRGYYGAGVRTAEVYLNRAEAYIAKYRETGEEVFGQAALDDLNELRRHRFQPGYVDAELSDFANINELLDFCWRERRRELAGEGNHRWFDLRRQGMPRIDHVFYATGGGTTTYTLEQGDSRYALPIPQAVLDQNPNLR